MAIKAGCKLQLADLLECILALAHNNCRTCPPALQPALALSPSCHSCRPPSALRALPTCSLSGCSSALSSCCCSSAATSSCPSSSPTASNTYRRSSTIALAAR